LTDEEIFNEGFSTEDNVNWHGELPKVWVDEIRKKLKSTNWKKKSAANDNGSEFQNSVFFKKRLSNPRTRV